MRIYRLVRRGRGHKKRGIECQDFAECRWVSAETLVLALSDGAGSAKFAREASRSNVEAVLELFSKISLEAFLRLPEVKQKEAILEACLEKLKKCAEDNQDLDKRQYSATLLFAVINEAYIYYGHLGDGAVHLTDQEGKSCFYSPPDNGETNRSTFFTVSTDALEHLRVTVVDRKTHDISMVLMMSDGPELMFGDRGFGNPIETAEEIAPFLVNGEVENDGEFEELLDEMTELESEKSDDWSLLAAVLMDKFVVKEEDGEETVPKKELQKDAQKNHQKETKKETQEKPHKEKRQGRKPQTKEAPKLKQEKITVSFPQKRQMPGQEMMQRHRQIVDEMLKLFWGNF